MEEPEPKISIRIQPLGNAPFTLSLSPITPIPSLLSTISNRLNGGRIRLLFSGKQLHDGTLCENGLQDGSALTVIRSAESAVLDAQSQKEDPLLRPFNAPPPRYIGTPSASARNPSLFGAIETLPGFRDRHIAEQILRELAEDRGFYSAMKKRGWSVGKLAEMYPAGRVGIDPVCVLGYNVGKGEEIRLRLRTDDLAGFRDMRKIRQVLAHELAHNVHSEHDNQFKELMLQVEREADRKDWKRSRGHTVAGDIVQGGIFPRRARTAPQRFAANAHASRLIREAEIRNMEARNLRIVQSGQGREEIGRHDGEGVCSHSDDCGICSETGKASVVESREREEGKTGSTDIVTSIASHDEDQVDVRNIQLTSGNVQLDEENEGRKTGLDDRQKEKSSKVSATKNSAEVEALLGMGFTRGMALLALRETRNDATRAADWIFANMGGDKTELNVAEEGVAEIQGALEKLELETETSEQLRITLDTLHLYISNVLRNPNNVRYREINGSNRLFRGRVAQFEAALSILKQSGFQQQTSDSFWRLSSVLDMAKLWMVKSVIQGRLIEELQKRDA